MNVLERDLDAIRWYVSNLRDVIAARPVRGLSEAEGGYEASMERLADAHRGAVEALYSAHDFISRVLKWEGDDDTEQSELLAEIAKHLSVGGQ